MNTVYASESMSRVTPISAIAATALAFASGVPCAIVQWITLDARSARVALETTDPDRPSHFP